MGCTASSPTKEEKTQALVLEGKSPFFIKESVQVIERTPGGSKTKLKKYRKREVPRLKSIQESNLLTKRSQTMNSISSLSYESSPTSANAQSNILPKPKVMMRQLSLLNYFEKNDLN